MFVEITKENHLINSLGAFSTTFAKLANLIDIHTYNVTSFWNFLRFRKAFAEKLWNFCSQISRANIFNELHCESQFVLTLNVDVSSPVVKLYQCRSYNLLGYMIS